MLFSGPVGFMGKLGLSKFYNFLFMTSLFWQMGPPFFFSGLKLWFLVLCGGHICVGCFSCNHILFTRISILYSYNTRNLYVHIYIAGLIIFRCSAVRAMNEVLKQNRPLKDRGDETSYSYNADGTNDVCFLCCLWFFLDRECASNCAPWSSTKFICRKKLKRSFYACYLLSCFFMCFSI